MKIGDVAEQLGITVQTLRYYEKEHLLETQKTAGGTRVYSADDIERIRAIRTLVELGIPHTMIRHLAQARSKSDTGDQACKTVSSELDDITGKLEQLQQTITETLSDIKKADQLVKQCIGCQTKPTRRNCAPCPVTNGLDQARLLQLIWDQDYET